MAQRRACKHDQWRGYMTAFLVNHRFLKSIIILTPVIRLMINFDVHTLRDCFHQEEKWMLAICYQLSTLSVLHLDHVHHLSHPLLPEKDSYCLPERHQ